MKTRGIAASTTALICILLAAGGAIFPAGTAWGVAGPTVVPPAGLFNNPLNQVAVPEPPNLFQFVKNKQAAIKLGKAFFWEMQTGSDNVQACGSCHFSAGADSRRKNTSNPGTRGNDLTFQVRGPNDVLQPSDFPFHQRDLPDFKNSTVIRDSNDVVGSQGVKLADFMAINAATGEETVSQVADQLFHTGNKAKLPNVPNPSPANNTRRVTARNTPSNINAVFNFHNFWDGRAHFIFNGVNPFGPLDTSARIRVNTGTAAVPALQLQQIAIETASLASQATGPPLDDTEMSAGGRTFPELGRKLMKLRPLGKQFVHPNDSVLGPFSRAVLQADGRLVGSPGLNDATTYEAMIKSAFVDNLWNSTALDINVKTRANPVAGDLFNQMEANFSLFWGLAIQLYEATLVSDQTPFDRFLGGDSAQFLAIPGAADGMNLFFGVGKCDLCHGGTELTTASVAAAKFVTNNSNLLIDQMPVASGLNTIYDTGFNDTSVRKITDDIGRGGNSPFSNPLTSLPIPLSYCAQAEIQVAGNLPFPSVVLPPQIPPTIPISNDAAFKVPGLRNVELTAPYFHDGSVMTLEDVVDFYTRGGNFPAANANHLDFNIAEIGALQNNPVRAAALVAFMKSLTDPRVKAESAPFDHPELFVPNGDPNVTDPEVLTRIPARGADGTAALPTNFRIDAVTSPTNKPSQLISGTKDAGAAINIDFNGVPITVTAAPADTVWSATLSGLAEGINVVSVTSVEPTGSTTLKANLVLDTVAPALTLNAVITPTGNSDQTISGTVETGIFPVVKGGTGIVVGPVSVSGATWSAQLSLLKSGTNAITVSASDPAGNVATQTASIVVFADGIFNGTKVPDISDALRALRMAVGLITPTSADLIHGDVAPLNAPDGKIDIADALLIMRNVVGTISLVN
jgi:cytochrome c peroxidase